MNALTPIGKAIASLLRNKWFWLLLLLIAAILIARKYWPDLMRALKPDRTNYADDPGLSEADRTRLERLAADLFAEFDGFTISTEHFQEVVALNDRELKYLANAFPHYSGGEKLRAAIADELIAGDEDARLIARLENMAE